MAQTKWRLVSYCNVEHTPGKREHPALLVIVSAKSEPGLRSYDNYRSSFKSVKCNGDLQKRWIEVPDDIVPEAKLGSVNFDVTQDITQVREAEQKDSPTKSAGKKKNKKSCAKSEKKSCKVTLSCQDLQNL